MPRFCIAVVMGCLGKVYMEKKCSTIMPNLLCLLLQFLYSIMFPAASQGATICHETKAPETRGSFNNTDFNNYLLELPFHSVDLKKR